MTTLIAPTAEYYTSWLAGMQAFGSGALDGSGYSQGSLPDVSRDAFATMISNRLTFAEPGPHLPSGYVTCSYLWIMEDDEFAGYLAIRHELNDDLLQRGGHIGYSVRPDFRRRGIATRALAQALLSARELGINDVLVTCDENNVGSRAVIEKNGGAYEDSRQGVRRYWFRTNSK